MSKVAAMDVMPLPKGADIGRHIYCDAAHSGLERAALMVWLENRERYIGLCARCADDAVAAIRRAGLVDG